jgi:hypothetical protein
VAGDGEAAAAVPETALALTEGAAAAAFGGGIFVFWLKKERMKIVNSASIESAMPTPRKTGNFSSSPPC